MLIKHMKPGTVFKLGDHVCLRLRANRGKQSMGTVPVVSFTWFEIQYWPSDDNGDVIGWLNINGILQNETNRF